MGLGWKMVEATVEVRAVARAAVWAAVARAALEVRAA